MFNKILSIFLMLAIFFSDLIAMDDKPDENVMVLRSGRQIPKVVSINSCLQLQTDPLQVADDEGQVRKRKREERKEEERRLVEMNPAIPPIVQGYEKIYERFLKGVLVYSPKKGKDKGRINLPIADLANPLEGTFDLSRCGNAGKFLSISTGYRKGQKPENASKVEIWLALRFLIEKELNTTAAHFGPIMANWKQEKAPVGLFWTWGGSDDMGWYDFLTTEDMDDLSTIDLYENCNKNQHSRIIACMACVTEPVRAASARVLPHFMFCL